MHTTFDEIIEEYVTMNTAPLLRRKWTSCTHMALFNLKKIRKVIDWTKVDKDDYLMRRNAVLKKLSLF